MNLREKSRLRILVFCQFIPFAGWSQSWDAGAHNLKLAVEQRGRYETRTANAFGKDPDISTGLLRTRLGLTYTPLAWLRLSGMVQDSRAPFYGPNAPNTVRDQADLHEGYVELFPGYKRGFGLTAGRMMLNYGEGRLIGSPQWGNLSRTFDHARAYWRLPKARLELLLVSPVKIRIGEFNRPVLGDRVWGVYNTFPDFYRKNLFETYLLRHDQSGKPSVNTAGFRAAGPVAAGVDYRVEAALQGAAAWFGALNRRWTVFHRALDVSGEYKYASATFDQMYAANHDKFGHEDLLGWRNIHNVRSLSTLQLSPNLAMNFMYDNYWLVNVKEGLYSGSGKLIARSAAGTAGNHVGQETDLYGTYKYRHFLFGAGVGRFFAGPFIRHTTPGAGPLYLYIFHTYSL